MHFNKQCEQYMGNQLAEAGIVHKGARTAAEVRNAVRKQRRGEGHDLQ